MELNIKEKKKDSKYNTSGHIKTIQMLEILRINCLGVYDKVADQKKQRKRGKIKH